MIFLYKKHICIWLPFLNFIIALMFIFYFVDFLLLTILAILPAWSYAVPLPTTQWYFWFNFHDFNLLFVLSSEHDYTEKKKLTTLPVIPWNVEDGLGWLKSFRSVWGSICLSGRMHWLSKASVSVSINGFRV